MPGKKKWQPVVAKAPPKKRKRRPTAGDLDPAREEERTLSWRLARTDLEGKWSWRKLGRSQLVDLRRILAEYEGTPLYKLEQEKRIRAIPVKDIESKAKERLKVIEQEDVDELWELRTGKGNWRVWGILIRSTFDILWWDPSHSVCRRLPPGERRK